MPGRATTVATVNHTAGPQPAIDTPPDLHREHVRYAEVDGLRLAYETFGDPADPAIVLVMGFATPMLGYHEKMCAQLAAAGHFVVRFDNRDTGLSSHFPGLPTPSLLGMLTGRNPAYRIADMAADAFGLVDHLQLTRFHLVGTSMGGFIAQAMALSRPERIATLTLVMTSTGSRRVGRPAPRLIAGFAREVPSTTRAESVAQQVETYRAIGSPDLDLDEVRTVAGWAWDRDPTTDGRGRQLSAILAQPDRTRALASLEVPTLVEHGLADPLVHPSGGLALARTIPGAVFIGHHGRGHDLTRSMWPRLGEDIADHIGAHS